MAVNRFKYVRVEGTGRAFADGRSGLEAGIAATTSLAIAGAFLGWAGLGLALGGTLAAILVALYIRSRIGGLVGDSYGAINEVVEAAMLMGVLALSDKGWLHALIWEG
jgi:cobalamin synthase